MFRPLSKQSRTEPADRSASPQVPARQRDAPSGVILLSPSLSRRNRTANKDRGCVFANRSARLSGIVDGLTRRGALRPKDVELAMREVRRALLEADVALDVARAFIDQVRKRAVGVEVIKSV